MNAQAINGRYDFANSGGALGTYRTGIIIPIKSNALILPIGVVTSLGSGGAATIDIGYKVIGNAAPDDPTFFAAAVPFGSFSSIPPSMIQVPLQFFNSSFAYEITMTVNGAPLTGGKMIFTALFCLQPF